MLFTQEFLLKSFLIWKIEFYIMRIKLNCDVVEWKCWMRLKSSSLDDYLKIFSSFSFSFDIWLISSSNNFLFSGHGSINAFYVLLFFNVRERTSSYIVCLFIFYYYYYFFMFFVEICQNMEWKTTRQNIVCSIKCSLLLEKGTSTWHFNRFQWCWVREKVQIETVN